MNTASKYTYTVTGMSCGHCVAAVTEELTKVTGIAAVAVDLESGRVSISGEGFSDTDVRTAIDEAGFAVAP